jgi:NTP pyrophosphatase (non-canonical NTP hydrolase)
MNLNQLAKQIHQNNKQKGFWDNERSNSELLMLVICELAEAVEADRKGRYANRTQMYAALRTNKDFVTYFEYFIKDTFEDEMADAIIRLLDMAAARGIELSTNIGFIETEGTKIYKQISKIEAIFEIVHIVYYIGVASLKGINFVLNTLFQMCKHWGIDIEWHIMQKIQYNKTRPHKHGKAY